MDMTGSGVGAVVVAELRAAGYMESTVGQYAKTIKALTEFASGREYSTILGAEFASMTTSVRTGRFSPQRRFDYRRLVTVFDSYVQTGRVNLSVRGRGGGGPRARGQRLRCAGRRLGGRDGPARSGTGHPRGLWKGGTWLPGVPGSTRYRIAGRGRWRQRPGVLGIPTGPVGQVVAVLGGVELSSVPEVHRPHRSGQCAESGWHQTLSRAGPRPG